MDTNVPSDTVASVQARALKAEKEVCAVHSSVCVPACHLLIASCPHSFDVFVTLPLPAIFLISLYTYCQRQYSLLGFAAACGAAGGAARRSLVARPRLIVGVWHSRVRCVKRW